MERRERLRQKRIGLAEARMYAELREKHAGLHVAKLNLALDTDLSLQDFDLVGDLPVEFKGKPRFKDCDGLVAAFTSEVRVHDVLVCCGKITGPLSGLIGFDGDMKRYMGIAKVQSISLPTLVDAARVLHDTVLFCPDGYGSVILVDHYEVRALPDMGFSLVVQGLEFERKFKPCFGT